MSRVWLRMAGTSEATKNSSSPRPTTTGGPERAATILFGSTAEITQCANTPVICLTAAPNGLLRDCPLIFLDKVSDDFSIGLGFESVAFGRSCSSETEVVLDDAVVNNNNLAFAIAVRVGVFFGRPAMRGPAGMTDSIESLDSGLVADDFFEIP